MFSTQKTKEWLREHTEDYYVYKSVTSDFRSRAAFKLTEIEERYKVLKSAKRIVELGCNPGGWTQVVLRSTDKNTKFIAIDKDPMRPFDNARDTSHANFKFLRADAFDSQTPIEIRKFFNNELADLVLCDMSPNISGEAHIDAENIISLNHRCMGLCLDTLAPGKTLVMKTFFGIEEPSLFRFCELYFKKVVRIKPSCSRNKSPEIYYLCTGFQQSPFFDLVAKKGFDISLEEFADYYPEVRELGHRYTDRMKEGFWMSEKAGEIKEEQIKFKFERELFAQRKPPKTHLTFKEEMDEINWRYNWARDKGLVDDMPDTLEETLEWSHRNAQKWKKEIDSLLQGKENQKVELLDLDEARQEAAEKADIEDTSLPGDFKFTWQKGYDEYLFREYKRMVLDKRKLGIDPRKEHFPDELVEELAAEKGMTKEAVLERLRQIRKEEEDETQPWLGNREELKKDVDKLNRQLKMSRSTDPKEREAYVNEMMKEEEMEARERGRRKNLHQDMEDLEEGRRAISNFLNLSNKMENDRLRSESGLAMRKQAKDERRRDAAESSKERDIRNRAKSLEDKRKKRENNPPKSK